MTTSCMHDALTMRCKLTTDSGVHRYSQSKHLNSVAAQVIVERYAFRQSTSTARGNERH